MSAAKEPQVDQQRPDTRGTTENLVIYSINLNHFSKVCDFLMVNIFTCHTGINSVSDKICCLITLIMAPFHLVFQWWDLGVVHTDSLAQLNIVEQLFMMPNN